MTYFLNKNLDLKPHTHFVKKKKMSLPCLPRARSSRPFFPSLMPEGTSASIVFPPSQRLDLVMHWCVHHIRPTWLHMFARIYAGWVPRGYLPVSFNVCVVSILEVSPTYWWLGLVGASPHIPGRASTRAPHEPDVASHVCVVLRRLLKSMMAW